MQKLPILPSLLVADERGSMKRPQLAEKGIITVENVEEKTAKIIRTCAPRQHKDKVYDMLLPMAKGTIDMYTVTIKGSTLTTWDKWNLKRLGQVGQAAIQVEDIQEKRRCVDKQIKFMVTTLMWNPKLLSFSVYHRRPVGGLNCVPLRPLQQSPYVRGPVVCCGVGRQPPAAIPCGGTLWSTPSTLCGTSCTPVWYPWYPCVVPLVPLCVPLVPGVVPLVPCGVPLVPCVVPLVPGVVPLVRCRSASCRW